MENMYHISVINVDDYPFEVGKIYEFKYMNEVIISMFQGISKISGDYLFFSELCNKSHGIQHFSYDRVFMSQVSIVTPLNDDPDYCSTSDIMEKDKSEFIIKYREYKIDKVINE